MASGYRLHGVQSGPAGGAVAEGGSGEDDNGRSTRGEGAIQRQLVETRIGVRVGGDLRQLRVCGGEGLGARRRVAGGGRRWVLRHEELGGSGGQALPVDGGFPGAGDVKGEVGGVEAARFGDRPQKPGLSRARGSRVVDRGELHLGRQGGVRQGAVVGTQQGDQNPLRADGEIAGGHHDEGVRRLGSRCGAGHPHKPEQRHRGSQLLHGRERTAAGEQSERLR